MFAPHNLIHLVLPLFLLASCTMSQDQNPAENTQTTAETTDDAASLVVNVPETMDENHVIRSESYFPEYIKDAVGNMSHATRSLLHKNKLVKYHYQRIGCNDEACKREWITFTAIQYPKDSVLQRWVADVLGRFYFDATRDLDIKVNGQDSEVNDDGEMVLKNTGCRPYSGILNDEGKAMFDYYQSYVWGISKNRVEEHGPSGRYGCAIYRCWQSNEIASYFVAYSTDVQHRSEHCVASFDRRTGKELSLTDILKDDYVAEFNDLVVDAARQRHFSLLHSKNNELAIDKVAGDYSSPVAIGHVGFVEEGIAVSTGALPFDQWAYSSHILIIPYEKVDNLLLDRFRK